MSHNTVAYDMDLHKLEEFIDSNDCVEIYPRYVLSYASIKNPTFEEEDWFSANNGDDLYETLHDWEDYHTSLEDLLYIDVYYQDYENGEKDHISRVYQHKNYTVEDIEKLI